MPSSCVFSTRQQASPLSICGSLMTLKMRYSIGILFGVFSFRGEFSGPGLLPSPFSSSVAIPSPPDKHARAHSRPHPAHSLRVCVCRLVHCFALDYHSTVSDFFSFHVSVLGSSHIRSIFEEVIFFWDISFSSLEQDFFFFSHFCLD